MKKFRGRVSAIGQDGGHYGFDRKKEGGPVAIMPEFNGRGEWRRQSSMSPE